MKPHWIAYSLVLLTAFLVGCQFNRRSGFVRIWADYNTLAAPAVFVEQQADRAYVPDCLFKHRPWIDNRRLRPPRGFQDVRSLGPPSESRKDRSSPALPEPLPPDASQSRPPEPSEQDRLPPMPAPPAELPDDEEPLGPSDSDAVPEPLPLPPEAPPSSSQQPKPWQPDRTPSDRSPSPPALFPTPAPPPLGPTARQRPTVQRSHFERPALSPHGAISAPPTDLSVPSRHPAGSVYHRPFGAWLFAEPSGT